MYPDLLYFLKIFRRRSKLALLCMAITLFAGMLAFVKSKDTYKAQVTAVIEQQPDSIDTGSNVINVAPIDEITSSLYLKLNQPEFLRRVTEAAEIDTTGRLRRALQSIKILGERTEDDLLSYLPTWASKRIFSNIQGNYITVSVIIEDGPIKAMRLANLIMEEFIQDELKLIVEKLDLKIQFLQRSRTESQELLRGKDDKFGGNKDRKLHSQELEIMEQIRNTERELSNLATSRARKLSELEENYHELSNRLSANHPQLIAKRAEIDHFLEKKSQNSDVSLALSTLRRELWNVRNKMKTPGASTQISSGYLTAEEQRLNKKIASLSAMIEQMEFQKNGTHLQIEEPTQRRKIRVVSKAVPNKTPYAKKKTKVLISSILLTLLTGVMAVALAEMRSPLASDAWRIQRKNNISILGQVSRETLSKMTNLSGTRIKELKEMLFEPDSASRELLAFRNLEVELLNSCHGKLISFAKAGSFNDSQIIYNLANVIAGDRPHNKTILVDFNSINPVEVSKQNHLKECLKSPKLFREKMTAPTDDRSFYYLAMGQDTNGKDLSLIRPDYIKNLFTEIAQDMDLILVRACEDSMFVENTYILGATDYGVVIVDAEISEFAEINRLKGQLTEARISAAMIFGT